MRLRTIGRTLFEYSMPLVLAACVAAAAAPAVRVLELRGAIAFGMIMMAGLFFGRLLVFAAFAYQIAQSTSPRTAGIVCHGITDALAILAAVALDRRLIFGAICGVLFAEAFNWWSARVSE